MAVSNLISNNRTQGRLRDCALAAPSPQATFVPVPPTLFTGRRQAVARVVRALGRVPMAIVYGVAGVGKSALSYACGAAWSGPICYLQAEADCPLPALVRDLFRRAAFDRVLESGWFIMGGELAAFEAAERGRRRAPREG